MAVLDFTTDQCDALVIGAGFAGMYVAGELAKRGLDVVLVSSGRPAKSGASLLATGYAAADLGNPRVSKSRGGARARVGSAGDNAIDTSASYLASDSVECHVADTVHAGVGLNDQALVEAVCADSPTRLADLIAMGVELEVEGGRVVRYAGGGHSFPRTVMTASRTPSGFASPLLSRIRSTGVTERVGQSLLTLVRCGGSVSGAVFADEQSGELTAVAAGATVMATGGYARLFENSSNPSGLNGDGCMAAFEAGAAIRDLEFVQFRPYSIVRPHALKGRSFSSSTFEYGATLRDAVGNDLLAGARSEGKEITRDVVSRLVAERVNSGAGVEGGAVVDLTVMEPGVLEKTNPVLAVQLSLKDSPGLTEQIVVAPQAHFVMGGVVIDVSGKAEIDRLYAVGEVSGGVHGASRLQDNALPELFAIGRRAAEAITRTPSRSTGARFRTAAGAAVREQAVRFSGSRTDLGQLRETEGIVRRVMAQKVGPARDETGLRFAKELMATLRQSLESQGFASTLELLQLTNLRRRLGLASLIIASALERRESRGAHFRLDHPDLDPDWNRSSLASPAAMRLE